jgi:hypothetical protein
VPEERIREDHGREPAEDDAVTGHDAIQGRITMNMTAATRTG